MSARSRKCCAKQAAARPDAKALRELLADGTIGREWTYAQLLHDAERCGRALAGRGILRARASRIMGGNCPEWIMVQLGAAMAGLTLVTINPAFIAPRGAPMCSNSLARVRFYYQPYVRGSALRPIVDEAAAGLPAADFIIDITDHGALFAGQDDGVLRETRSHDIVMIQYTRAPPVFPRGCCCISMVWCSRTGICSSVGGWKPGTPSPVRSRLFHTAGSAVSVLGVFAHGATLLLVSVFDPVAVAKAIEREKTRGAGRGFDHALRNHRGRRGATGTDVSSVKSVVSGGAMVPPALNAAAQEVFGVPILIVYGQTETSPAITAAWPTDTGAELTETIGQPCSHMEVSIRNPADNSVCAVDEQGGNLHARLQHDGRL